MRTRKEIADQLRFLEDAKERYCEAKVKGGRD